jgi:hypothetical protein
MAEEKQPDWLDIGSAIEQLKAEPDWLSTDEVVIEPDWLNTAPSVDGIEVPRAAAPYAKLRFEVMKGSNRVWACNGRYVACRPSGFNEATRSRHNRFLASGHYKHISTSDDVQIFELLPSSSFYRTEGDVRAGGWYELLRAAAQAAVARDWGAYVDLLEEIATRLKSTPTGATGAIDTDLAKDRFADTLEHLEQLIYMRWTYRQEMKKIEDHNLAMIAMRAEIDAGVQNVRAARGHATGRKIALPSRGAMIIR